MKLVVRPIIKTMQCWKLRESKPKLKPKEMGINIRNKSCSAPSINTIQRKDQVLLMSYKAMINQERFRWEKRSQHLSPLMLHNAMLRLPHNKFIVNSIRVKGQTVGKMQGKIIGKRIWIITKKCSLTKPLKIFKSQFYLVKSKNTVMKTFSSHLTTSPKSRTPQIGIYRIRLAGL